MGVCKLKLNEGIHSQNAKRNFSKLESKHFASELFYHKSKDNQIDIALLYQISRHEIGVEPLWFLGTDFIFVFKCNF